MFIPNLLTLIVFGPTQYGKTSFIKALGGAVEDKDIGTGEISVTSRPHIYRFNVTWVDEYETQEVEIIDLPGLDDTDLRMSNEYISELVRIFIAHRNISKIDAILLFNSLADDSVQIKRTAKTLIDELGNVKESIVVILSKADISRPLLEKTAIEDCKSLGIPYAKWSKIAEGKEKERQTSSLRAALRKVKAFTVEQTDNIEKKIMNRAEYLKDNDNQKRKVWVIEGEKEYEEVKVMKKVQKYPTLELQIDAANFLQATHPIVERCNVKKFVINKDGTLETVVVSGTCPKDFDFYLKKVQEETIQIEVIEMLEKIDQMKKLEIREKPLEYYIQKAKEEYMKEAWVEFNKQ